MKLRIAQPMMLRTALSIFTIAAAALAEAPKPPSTVTREECIATAEAYRTFQWTPTAANILHGADADGIRVDTPDASYKPKRGLSGWWKPGVLITSMPYKWGGFDTPESFLAGLAEGKAAGDVATPEKRKLLDAAVSKHTVGIDCSGFISRCWNLPRAWSTRTITELCDPVQNLRDLKPGDILNTYNSHVFLFKKWIKDDRSRMLVYTTGTKPIWGVQVGPVFTRQMVPLGFTAWRYRGMKD